MTTISADTSPLQAAREWRGLSLVAAAMSSGLTLVQAEAIEAGDPTAFSSIDEMIASAVVYGATIGIGRDEAMALLDRTVCGSDLQVEFPDSAHPGFRGDVQVRNARIEDVPGARSEAIAVAPFADDLGSHPVLDPINLDGTPLHPVTDPVSDRVEAAATVHDGPTPDQAVAASGEIDMTGAFSSDAPWDRPAAGELASWVEGYDDFDDSPSAVLAPRLGTSRLVTGVHAGLERIVGTDRADVAADWMTATGSRISELLREGRERLRRSEHATLIVAIGGGAVLIALVVAISGAIGANDDTSTVGPETNASAKTAVTAPAATDATTATKAADTTPATPMLVPARLAVDVYNAGSKKGYAKTVADQLKGAGYRIGEVTNADSAYTTATLIYPKGLEREARVLARKAGITTMKPAPGTSRRMTVVVM